jgi:peptidoglycan/LPS O-acetylase OafA/YrhL
MPAIIDKPGLHVDGVDYLRGLAIIAVLALHTSARYGEISTINLLAI